MMKIEAKIERRDCEEWLVGGPFCDMMLMSPPYPLKEKRYGKRNDVRSVNEWVQWMFRVIQLCVQKTRGDIFVVVNDTVRHGACIPATAMLRTVLQVHGVQADRPLIWHKNAAPNRKDYPRNDHEYILCFKGQAGNRVWNLSDVAQPRKYSSGGRFRQRSNADGKRKRGGKYPTNKMVAPGDVIRVTVGGGHMGFDAEDGRFACSGKAPFPYLLAETIIKMFSKPGQIIGDPFAGTATTLVAALRNGRHAVGCDNDADAIDIARPRIARAKKLIGL